MGYIVTDILDINSQKSRIELDCNIKFALYKGEIRRYHIEPGEELEDRYYHMIMNEILPKRARERCLNLLAKRNMTEYELRNKLSQGFYPENIIEDVILKLISYKLIDDEDYARSYIESYCKTKSRRQIIECLYNKGLDRSRVSELIDESGVNEEEGIRRIIDKKRIDVNSATREELNKLFMYLVRKGYNYDLVRKVCYDAHR